MPNELDSSEKETKKKGIYYSVPIHVGLTVFSFIVVMKADQTPYQELERPFGLIALLISMWIPALLAARTAYLMRR